MKNNNDEITEFSADIAEQIIRFADKLGENRNKIFFTVTQGLRILSLSTEFDEYKFKDEE